MAGAGRVRLGAPYWYQVGGRDAEVSPVHAFGVVEFYTMYKQAPIGRYLIQVCHNVAVTFRAPKT